MFYWPDISEANVADICYRLLFVTNSVRFTSLFQSWFAIGRCLAVCPCRIRNVKRISSLRSDWNQLLSRNGSHVYSSLAQLDRKLIHYQSLFFSAQTTTDQLTSHQLRQILPLLNDFIISELSTHSACHAYHQVSIQIFPLPGAPLGFAETKSVCD